MIIRTEHDPLMQDHSLPGARIYCFDIALKMKMMYNMFRLDRF